MRRALSRLLGIAPPPPQAPPLELPRKADYKGAWNEAARVNAADSVLTGASPDTFEATGRSDAALVARHLPREAAVLDIGCGIGRVERYLAPLVRELWAIDVSGEMLRRAAARLAGIPNVHLREVGNGEFLSFFESGRFDLVFSLLVLQHLEREDAFLYLRDAHRVLTAGGVLVTQFPNFLSPVYSRAFVEGAGVADRSPGRVRAFTEAEVRQVVTLAGFEVLETALGGHSEPTAEIYVVARKPRS